MVRRTAISRLWIAAAAVAALAAASLVTYACAVPRPEGSGVDASEAVPVPTE